ncbi:hypothetical protein ACLK1T_17810 [Escherichia coli]
MAFLRCLSAPVFIYRFFYSEHAVELPAGVTAVINGNEQRRLELESAACRV